MHQGSPIPANVDLDDPLWVGRFSDLANQMILLGAKPKLVACYTGLNQKAISERYRKLTGQEPPGGRMAQTQPKFFVASNANGYDFNLQSAIFAKIYINLEAAMGEPVHAGWLLVTAYQAYLRLTEDIASQVPRLARLTLGNAYDLMMHVGFRRRHLATISLKECADCGSPYLVSTEVEKDACGCPLCAMQRRQDQLAVNLDRTKQKRASGAVAAR